MSGDLLLVALGLAFVFEALAPFVAPAAWRRAIGQMLQMQDGQIRFMALLGLMSGLALIWLAT